MADDGSDSGFDVDAIDKLFLKAKTGGGPFNFAFGLGAKAEDCALIVHMRKAPKALKGEVKSLPQKIGKMCSGTFTVEEKDVKLSPSRPVKGMIKQLRKKFRDEGLNKYKPVLVGPDGLEIDEDSLPDDLPDEDDDSLELAGTETEAEEQAPETQPTPDLTEAKKRLAGLIQRVQALAPELAERLRAACQIAAQQIGAQDAAAAGATMDRIEQALDRAGGGQGTPPEAPPQPALPRLQEAMAKLVQRIRALPEGDARTMLGTQAREILGWINEGAVERAMAGIRTLTQDLAAAESAGQGGGGSGSSDPLEIWRGAKEKADVGLGALQSALKGFADPDLDRIAEFGLNGVTEGLQTALMAALFNWRDAPPEGRPRAAAALASRAQELRKKLDSDPVIELCEANPFGIAVDIRGPLGAALSELERLAAA